MTRRALVVISIALVAAMPLLPGTVAKDSAVTVLIDPGDGTYEWTFALVPEANHTALRATELASIALGLPPPNVTWFDSSFCVRRPCAFVNDIGEHHPVDPAYWHLFLWNASSAVWASSALGPSDTDLSDGAVIAWYLAVDNPSDYTAPHPVPRVDFQDVHASFRGDLRNRGLAGPISESLRLAWDVDVGVAEIDTTPVVAYGRVFIATRNALVALDAYSGQQAWRNPQVRSLLSTPALDDDHLILGGTDGRLHSVWASNGTEAWSVLLESGARSTGIASSPAVFNGRAYLGTFNETAGGMARIAAVNLNNGTVAWTFETGSVHMSAPAIANRSLYVGVMGVYDGGVGYGAPHGVLALALNGSREWFYSTDGSVASSPVVWNGTVYATDKASNVYALRTDGTLRWRQTLAGPSTSGPALAGDTLFVASGAVGGSGAVAAFTFDGMKRWERSVGGAVQSSLLTDGNLVCGATNVANGSYFCLRTSDGAIRWSYTPSPPEYILSSLAAVGGGVYASSDNGHVYAFQGSHPTLPEGSSFVTIVVILLVIVFAIPLAVFYVNRRRRRSPPDV